MGDHIKAASFNHTVDVLRESVGKDKLGMHVSKLPGAMRELFERHWLSVEWVPVRLYYEGLAELLRSIYPFDHEEIAVDLARRVCARDFNTIYRVMIRLGSPEFVVRRATVIWNKYFDSGKFVLVNQQEVAGHHHFRLHLDYKEPLPLMVTFMRGYVEQLLSMSGAKGTKVLMQDLRMNSAGLSCNFDVAYD